MDGAHDHESSTIERWIQAQCLKCASSVASLPTWTAGRSSCLPTRGRELLARLALAPGPHPRSMLARRLRPDVPEDSARKTLRNALYELRRALGPAGRDALVVTGQRVGLSHRRVAIDGTL